MNAPVNIAALAPPSTPARPVPAVTREQLAFAEALERIQSVQPVLFGALRGALHAMLDPELRHLVRVPTKVLKTSQGRAQIADDVTSILDNCAEIVRRARASQHTPSSTAAPPSTFTWRPPT